MADPQSNKPVEKMLDSFSQLSMSDMRDEFGGMSMEIMNRKVNYLSSTSHGHKLLRTELQEVCEFIVARLSGPDTTGTDTNKGKENAGDLGEEKFMNNELYEGQLSHLPKHEREFVQIMLEGAMSTDGEITELMGSGSAGKGQSTFYELTGVATEEGVGAKKDAIIQLAITTPPTSPVTTATATAAPASTAPAPASTTVTKVPPPKVQNYRDWHRQQVDKAKMELRWLNKHVEEMAGLARWDELWRQYFEDWKTFYAKALQTKWYRGRTSDMVTAETAINVAWGPIREKWLKASGGKALYGEEDDFQNL